MKETRVSIVIPTYNGGVLFKKCLEAIYSQKADFPYEVIVIDSGSRDETVSVARDFPVRLIEIEKKDFDHGATRNMGIGLSRGEFVTLMTQDAIPSDSFWLSSLIKPFYEDELVAGVYARQIPREDADCLTKRNLNRWLTGRTVRDVKSMDERNCYEKLPPMEKYRFCNFDDVCSCIRKGVWEKIPYERAAFAEDLDWSKKVLEAGYKIVYEPGAAVVHSHNKGLLYEYRRTYVCHRRLSELFGLRTVPTMKHVLRFTLSGIKNDIPYVWGNEAALGKKLSLTFRVPLLSFLGVYAQYRGARDQMERAGSEPSKEALSANPGADTKRVGDLWSHKASPEEMEKRKLNGWMPHPYVRRFYINKKISGHPDVGMLMHFKNKYIPNRLKYGLTLGCGDGCLERHAFKLGICERFDAFDVAEGAIEIARKKAAEEGVGRFVNYEVRDINSINLEENKYDVVFAFSSAHHFKELEHVFNEVKKALKPSGFFMLDEYIGPSQFQWTDRQLRIINNLLAMLPTKYKKLIPLPGKIKEREERPSLEWMNNHDPSEAIRSEEILPRLAEYFDVIEKIDYGGTILHTLLKGIAGNFDHGKEEDLTLLKMLCYIENILIEEKIISSDFAGIVARNIKKQIILKSP